MSPATPAERSRAYRRRNGIQAVELLPHGTRAAAQRHRRSGEPLCPDCLTAERDYMRQAAIKRKDSQRERDQT